MRGSLKRLLRLRAIKEELRRAELEAGIARLRKLEESSAVAWEEACASRERWFTGTLGRGSPGASGLGPEVEARPDATPPGRAEEAVWELAMWRRRQAEARRPAQLAQVERGRAEFLARRRDRLQLETLVEAEEKADLRRQNRREQQRLDDWHQARRRQESGTRVAGFGLDRGSLGSSEDEESGRAAGNEEKF